MLVFIGRRRAVKDVGQAILGFGLLFLGLRLILDGVAPIRQNELTLEVLRALAANPLTGVLVGAGLSAALASSAATIGVAIALASAGLLALPGAVAIVLGANVGTCATALAASLGANADAKRVAVAHIGFKLLGVVLIFPFIGPFTDWVAVTISPRVNRMRTSAAGSAPIFSAKSVSDEPRGMRTTLPLPRGAETPPIVGACSRQWQKTACYNRRRTGDMAGPPGPPPPTRSE